MKRINVTIRADQYEQIGQEGLNASGLIRGLLDDHFSDEKIVFSVSRETRQFYEQVISNFGGEDKELEAFFRKALDEYLVEKTEQIAALRKTLNSGDTVKRKK